MHLFDDIAHNKERTIHTLKSDDNTWNRHAEDKIGENIGKMATPVPTVTAATGKAPARRVN